jgi:hypothetical protein
VREEIRVDKVRESIVDHLHIEIIKCKVTTTISLILLSNLQKAILLLFKKLSDLNYQHQTFQKNHQH